MAIHPGDILAGFRVTQLLGRGGMGEVWAAVSADGQRQVAIKVLLPRAALKPDLVLRFEREARAAAAIESPFVCRLLALEQDEQGAHLLVFERLAGESLAERLKRELYLPFAEVGLILEDVWQALVAAHDAGVIHRDLKPGNIYIERTDDPGRPERAKVLDFGISKFQNSDGEPSLTDFDATLGSFAYMAPEQVRGAARADERADVYAVGAVAFRALSGRLPFEGTSAGMIMALKVDRPAPSLSEVTDEQWPAGLERFLARALHRDREERFATAMQALDQWRLVQPLPMPQRAPAPRGRQAARAALDADDAKTTVDGAPTMTEASFAPDWDQDATRTQIDDDFEPSE